jgi:heme a synthase
MVRPMNTLTQTFGYSLPETNRKQVAIWLLVVAALVFAMVLLGGVTRLTNSGLSMVEWKPVTGWLPPLSEQAWTDEFDKYKAFPEYQKVNKGMSLSEFKGIFVFEYSHRVLGRIIGLAFFVPMLAFIIRGKVRMTHVPRLIGLLVLGGMQGVMGWVMVKSGLVDHPDVSHYRLTAHLFLACLIFAALLWTAFDLLSPAEMIKENKSKLLRLAQICFGLIFLQLLIGGFVAGLNAGFVYNNWPLMGDGFLPDDLFFMTPWYVNFLENVATIQFSHRMVAYGVFLAVLYYFIRSRQHNSRSSISRSAHYLLAGVLVQVLLGIWTLLAVVPVSLGALHQGGGLLVLLLATYSLHRVSRAAI